MHGNFLVNTLALFYSLFLVILGTSAAIAHWSPALLQVPRQPDANHGWQTQVQGTEVTSAAAIRLPVHPRHLPGDDSQKILLTRGKRQHF